jgi:hypothetical protein
MSRFTAVVLLFALAGCDRIDPYQREGVWRPKATNDANLHRMVAVPSDLKVARRAGPADGGLAGAALTRLRHDRVRPLLDSGIANVVPVTSAPVAPQPAAPSSGTGQ